MSRIIVYYRVSTDRQEKSGLGIDGQKAAVRQYVARTGAELIRSYTETESGKNSERPQFARAVAHARRSRATLVVAKLDRLARNLAFLDTLQRSKLNFVALDCEHANKAMLQMMMIMAEWEVDQISARTKAALQARRERGGKLGAENPNCRNLTARAMKRGRKLGAEANKRLADEAYADILPEMREWAQSETLQAIANRLNKDGHTTRTGKDWTPGTVANVLRRAEA